jgi:hypothetical protein
MEIKDLAMTVELGSEMAEVRGGSYYSWPSFSSSRRTTAVGNTDISGLYSTNNSSIYNGDANSYVSVDANNMNGSGIDVKSAVNSGSTNSVTQSSGIALDLTSAFSNSIFSS